MQEEKGHVVKVFFPESVHHAMRVLLVSQRLTWEQWALSMAYQTIEEGYAQQEKGRPAQTGRRHE